jgi:hypothetical protein
MFRLGFVLSRIVLRVKRCTRNRRELPALLKARVADLLGRWHIRDMEDSPGSALSDDLTRRFVDA